MLTESVDFPIFNLRCYDIFGLVATIITNCDQGFTVDSRNSS